MFSMHVFFGKLPKPLVLLALYNHAKFAGKGFNSSPVMTQRLFRPVSYKDSKFIIDEALKNRQGYIDYIDLGAGSKPIKAHLTGSSFDSTQYDHNHGDVGYAGKIVDALRIEYIESLDDSTLLSCGIFGSNNRNTRVASVRAMITEKLPTQTHAEQQAIKNKYEQIKDKVVQELIRYPANNPKRCIGIEEDVDLYILSGAFKKITEALTILGFTCINRSEIHPMNGGGWNFSFSYEESKLSAEALVEQITALPYEQLNSVPQFAEVQEKRP